MAVISLFKRLGGRAVLASLLNHFYADVRQHQLLGPVFEQYIDDWPEHIEKIADFWTQVAGGPANYGGGMPARHIPLGLRVAHFQAWLGLWKTNCSIWLGSDCAHEMSELAVQIAKRLRMFCDVSQPPVPNFNPFKTIPVLKS
jgi:hemoglobin